MTLKETFTEEIFTRVQNTILRWALKDYQMRIESISRGDGSSWETVAHELVDSESFDLVVAKLDEEEESAYDQDHSSITSKSRLVLKGGDACGLSITGKKLDRFVDGEKSRSTKRRKRTTPEVWVRYVIRDFLSKIGSLPSYFNEPSLEAYFPAFVMADYFLTGLQPQHALIDVDLAGNYRGRKKAESENRPRRLGFHIGPQERFYEVEESSSYRVESGAKVIRGSGWATIPPFGGMVIFLQDQDEDDLTHRLYIAQSLGCKDQKLVEFTLFPYQGQETTILQIDPSMKKSEIKSLFFIKDIPESFDRVPISVKRLKKRTPRGEAALKLEYEENIESREERMVAENIDVEFQCAVCAGDMHKVESLIDSVVDINRRVAGSGGTVLHVVADEQLKDIFRILRQRQDLNYLVKDNGGRLPSQLAMNSDEDVGLGTYLKRKEMQQARREGKDYRAFAMD